MMGAPQRTKIILLAVLGVAAAALAFVAFGGIEKNLVYYLGPDELLARGEASYGATVRLGGLVQKHSVNFRPETSDLSFRLGVTLEGEPSVLVSSRGAPPQMFQEDIGAVIEGTYDGHVFHAERVMVKHSNEYRPPAEGEKPSDVYKTLVAVPDAS